MNLIQFVKDYLSFSRRERTGILLLAALIFIVFLLPAIVTNNSRNARLVAADTAWIAAARALEINETREPAVSGNYNSQVYQYDRPATTIATASELFFFDPNTLAGTGWKKLGLKDKTIRTIQNYVAKGGRFYNPEDLKRIYGLPPETFRLLEPFIKIETARLAGKKTDYVKKVEDTKRSPPAAIDINTADTSAFIALPGIGSKLAARITGFREKLGGFYSIEQVGETYGLPDSSFQKIKPFLKLGILAIKKISINEATIDELKSHPYIKFYLAKQIIAYRDEHGPFTKLEELTKIMAVTPEVYEKVRRYFSL